VDAHERVQHNKGVLSAQKLVFVLCAAMDFDALQDEIERDDTPG
jgi:hypothetical protein